MLIGKRDTRDWNKEDIDWDAIDSQLVSHRIVITRPEINGKRLGAVAVEKSIRDKYNPHLPGGNRVVAHAGLDVAVG